MNKPAAIAAQVVDIQNDRQHKGFVKVTLHVPAELGAQLTESLGWPTYTTPVPVAIARLKQQQEEPTTATEKPAPVSPPVRVPRKWNELSMPQQAGIMGETEAFRKFMCEKYGYTHADCPLMIRQECKVESRKELLPGTLPGTTWLRIVADYRAWMHEPEYV